MTEKHNNAPSHWLVDTFFNRSTSEEERYESTLSVAPLRIMVCSTMSALKTTYQRVTNLSYGCQSYKGRRRTIAFGSRNRGASALQTS